MPVGRAPDGIPRLAQRLRKPTSASRKRLPYLKYVQNTSISWGIRLILEDLYNWKEPLTADNWQRLDGMIRERADDRAWQREIMRRTNIKRYCTEHARRESGKDKDILQYALEWAFFTRCQWGEFDTALYEVERCWGKTPASPSPIGGGQAACDGARDSELSMTFTRRCSTMSTISRITRFFPPPRIFRRISI